MPLKQENARATDTLSAKERDFLREAEKRYRANTNWFDFEDFAFGMRSPLFSRQRSHLDVLKHPLYIALREMWLELGVKQGLVSPSKRAEAQHAGRKARRSGSAIQERNSTQKRNVAASDSSSRRHMSKSRA
jgi:hypothetical protein